MVMPNDTRGQPPVAAVVTATPPVEPPPNVQVGEKIYTEVEHQVKADVLLTTQYNKLNTTLSQQGVELAKLRPMETENVTLRTRVRTLEDEADTIVSEGVRSSIPDLELQTRTRQLRVDRRSHEDEVRAHTIKVAEFTTNEARYATWNDQHNMENENSIAFIAGKYKIKSEELNGIPVEGRGAFAERLAGTQSPTNPVNPVTTEPVVSSLIENGVGQGGQQLTGDAAAAAALKRARERQRNS